MFGVRAPLRSLLRPDRTNSRNRGGNVGGSGMVGKRRGERLEEKPGLIKVFPHPVASLFQFELLDKFSFWKKAPASGGKFRKSSC